MNSFLFSKEPLKPVRKNEPARAEGPRCSHLCCNGGELKEMVAAEITEGCACVHISDLAFVMT